METLFNEHDAGNISSLLCILPQYCRLSPAEMEALILWQAGIGKAVSLRRLYGERWMLAAVQDVRAAAVLADKWLYADTRTLQGQKPDGLNDFALATFAGVLEERDSETAIGMDSSQSWEKMCDIYWQLIRNRDGTVLLNYSWLFNDMIRFARVKDDTVMTALQRMALAFELKKGTPEGLVHMLLLHAEQLLLRGKTSDGTVLVARLIENHPWDYGVYEAAATAFFNSGELWLGQLVLDAAALLPKNRHQLNRYRDLCTVYSGSCRITQLKKPAPNYYEYVALALRTPIRPQSGNDKKLVRELVPGIDEMRVKRFRV
ncbi:MAG: hypothetical protein JXX14_13935 [Deltaproteobacteria bacterium]|nr:hypothetical protein [Deltaproteobacteria bacterium]